MPTSTPAAIQGSKAGQGRRKALPASPTALAHPSPLPTVPRIRLSIRPNTPQPHAGSSNSPSNSIAGPSTQPKRKVGRPRKSDTYHLPSAQPARKTARTKKRYNDDDSNSDSSDLTPPEDDGDESEAEVTPRRRPVGRPKSSDKGKGKAGVVRKKARTAAGSGVQHESGPSMAAAASKVTVSGPAGRQRRRAVKLEDSGRRRARDAKFDITEDAFAGSIPPEGALHIRSFLDSDSASSFGDDESDHMSPADLAALEGMLHESDDDETKGLPEAFAGQDIEDLAYGAHAEVDMEREVLAGWFEEEDEEMFISHLSGSEADQQSQSSAHDSANSDADSSSSESEAEDEVDEFGFPMPLSNAHLGADDEEQPGLVLMENWDGKLVLYQTKPPRTKHRNRSGSRGSRTNGSVAGSTNAPSASDQLDAGDRDLHLMIDPEAMAAEYDEDATSSEEWSGESDEMDGDTTDSMDEDDMPMLDSPAMQELIDQQIGLPSPDAADGLIGEPLIPSEAMGAPAIIVTDTAMVDTTIDTTPISFPSPMPAQAVPHTSPMAAPPVPQTPGGSVIPMMGTFLPTSTDPAQHAVIDGSGASTKSPFTHRRRSRKNRADSVSSGGARSSRSMTTSMSMSTVDRKRKSGSAALSSSDPFGGPPIIRGISKKARYTSIPGHPKYVQAQQRIEEDREGTSTEEDEEGGEFDLEDMLDPALLQQLAQTGAGAGQAQGQGQGGEEHMRHLIRFDRVPVSAYIQRNCGGGSRERFDGLSSRGRSSPVGGAGGGGGRGRQAGSVVVGMLPEAEGATTLMGAHAQARMMVSPLVAPVAAGIAERQVESLHI